MDVGVEAPADAVHHLIGPAISRNQPDSVFRLPNSRLRRFAAILRELGTDRDIDAVLQLAVDLATELIDSCDLADVMFTHDGRTTVPVASDSLSVTLADAQQESGGGPCLDVFEDHESVVVHDLVTDHRWPGFAKLAARHDVRSGAAFRLFVHRNHEDRFGALNLYGFEPGFDEADVHLAEVIASYCSTALHAAIKQEGLKAALESRDLIGQAKGVLMAHHHLTADEAYDMLRRASQKLNVKVVELAGYVTRTGGLH